MTAALAVASTVLVGFTLVGVVVFIVAAFTDPAPTGAGLDLISGEDQ
jgi:hypothetical protein